MLNFNHAMFFRFAVILLWWDVGWVLYPTRGVDQIRAEMFLDRSPRKSRTEAGCDWRELKDLFH